MQFSELGVIYDFHGVLATHNRKSRIERLVNAWNDVPYYEFILRKGAAALMTSLFENKIPQAIATRANRSTIFQWYYTFGISQWIPEDSVIYAEDPTDNKLESFQRAAKSIHRLPEQCILFEDDGRHILDALEVGFQFQRIYAVESSISVDNAFLVPAQIQWIRDFTNIKIDDILKC